MDGPEGGTELFLVVEAGESAQDRLEAALAAGSVASVLIVPLEGQALSAADAGPLVQSAQSKGAAALILDEPTLARETGAHGVHLSHRSGIELRFRAARQTLGQSAIVGIDAGRSRHDAMTLAEAGADYVAFSIPAGVHDSIAARDRRLDLVAWWAEIFEVPCVALDVEAPDEAAALAHAGADFVGIRIEPGAPLPEIRRHIEMMSGALQPTSAH